jgi:hypothetical protein
MHNPLWAWLGDRQKGLCKMATNSKRMRARPTDWKQELRNSSKTVCDAVNAIASLQNEFASGERIFVDDTLSWLLQALYATSRLGERIATVEAYFMSGYRDLCGTPIRPAVVHGQAGSCYHNAAARWTQSVVFDLMLRRLELPTASLETECGRVSWIDGPPHDIEKILPPLLANRRNEFIEWADEVGSVNADAITAQLTLELNSAFAFLAPIDPELTATEARNKFCFEQWQGGKTLKEINTSLRNDPEWEPYEDEKAVRSAINAWAKKAGQTPRRGQPGRPRSRKR